MVYCGKPSKGCKSCRERKTRCDKATPSCSQCIRAHRICPGYRNQLDLMFRIQNDVVIEKSKSRDPSKPMTHSKRAPAASKSSEILLVRNLKGISIEDEVFRHSREYVDRQGAFVTTLLPTFSMSPDLEQRARGFFATHSVELNPDFDLVHKLCTQTSADAHLLASINAVGLASFSQYVHSPELMVKARQDYILALGLTNAALRSPKEVKKDSTLFSVMILSIFETIAGTTVDSLVAWTEHVSGAAALVKLRGHEQFKTEAGQRLFQQVTSNLMISCIQRSTPMPAHVLELRETMAENIDASSLTWKLSSCIVDFTIFRAAVRSFQVTGPRVIVKAALELDQRFLEIFKDPPDTWSYETVYTEEDPHLIWNKYYHVYPDKVCSQIWNGFRTCRILLHEIIREQVLTSKSAITPIFSEAEADLQCEASREIMLEMRAGILASVPQTNPDPLIHGTATHSLSYYIMWPLYLVAVMDLTTNEVRCWVAQRLRSIAREVGIQQAGVMADFLDRKEPLDPWLLNAPTPRKLPKLFRMKLDEERTLEIDEERAVDIMMPTRSALRTSSQCENPPAIQDLEATTRPCDM